MKPPNRLISASAAKMVIFHNLPFPTHLEVYQQQERNTMKTSALRLQYTKTVLLRYDWPPIAV